MAKINRLELLEVLKKAVKIVPTSCTVEAAKGILIETGEGFMKLSATDLITSIISKLPSDMDMLEKDTFIVDAKLFLEIISKISSEEVTITINDNNIGIVGGNSKFNILSKGTAEDFPNIDRNIENKQSITLNNDVFRSLVNKTIRFSSDDETRPILQGVNVVFSSNKVTAISLDGYRLAFYDADIENDIEKEVVIDSVSLSTVAKSLNSGSVTIIFNSTTRLIEFNFGDTSIYTTQLEGKFFDYKSILTPNKCKTTITVDSGTLKNAIERVNIMAKLGTNKKYILTEAKENSLILTTDNDMGKVVESIGIDSLEGETLNYRIAFNPKYILDGLNVIGSKDLEIKFMGPNNPAYLIDKESNFIYLMLPIRVSREAEESEEKAS